MNNVKTYLKEKMDNLANLSAEQIGYAYYANILAALVLLRAGNQRIVRVLKDAQHKTLKSYGVGISPLNFWGLVVHNSKNKAFDDIIGKRVRKDLDKMSGRFFSQSIRELHFPLSVNPTSIVWDDIMDLVHIYSLRVDAYDTKTRLIRGAIRQWDSLKPNAKASILQHMFFYLNQNDPHSVMLPLLRISINDVLLHPRKHANDEAPEELEADSEPEFYSTGGLKTDDGTEVNQDDKQPSDINNKPVGTGMEKDKVVSIKKKPKDTIKEAFYRMIAEEGEGDGGAAVSTTSAGAIASLPTRIINGQVLRRKPRKLIFGKRKKKLRFKKHTG